MFKRLLVTLAFGIATVCVGRAIAAPVTYNLSGTVSLHVQGSVFIGLDYQIPALGLGPFTIGHDVAFSGDLVWNVAGSTQLDWGSPDWSGQFIFPSLSTFHAVPDPSSGGVNATAPIDVNVDVAFVHIHEHFDPGIYLNAAMFNLRLPADTSGTPVPPTPGAGPWLAQLSDEATSGPFLCVGLTSGGCLTGPVGGGLTLAVIPLLSRVGASAAEPLGTGSALALGIPTSASGLVDSDFFSTLVQFPGCEGHVVVGFVDECAFDLLNYRFIFNGPVTLSNVNLVLTGAADTGGSSSIQQVIPGSVSSVPEPATLALLGIALAGLGFARRRKLH